MQKNGYLPEIQTDFIFANIGEELGVVATLFIIIAFVVIALCGIIVAINAPANLSAPYSPRVYFLNLPAGR